MTDQPSPDSESGAPTGGIYVASKTRLGAMWRGLRDRGVPIISTWIDECEQGQTNDFADLWLRCIGEVTSASALVAVHEPDDVWKGAFLEIGAAIASGVPVLLIGQPPGTWMNHPLVKRMASLTDALAAAQESSRV